jgi:hypothetical protein
MNPSLDIHRLLDEAFAGIAVTPEVQDLKEEVRGNLVARVTELTASGVAPSDAAQRAVDELGDVRALVEDMDRVGGPSAPWQGNRVRPRPAFVVRTVVLALLTAAGSAVAALLALDILQPGSRPVLDYVAAVGVAALSAAVIVGDALRQETTTNYPVGRARAWGYSGSAASAASPAIFRGVPSGGSSWAASWRSCPSWSLHTSVQRRRTATSPGLSVRCSGT